MKRRRGRKRKDDMFKRKKIEEKNGKSEEG